MKLIESCIIICLFFSIALSVTTVEAQETVSTIYVDDDNTEGPWDGTTEHPFQYIQDGIDACIDGDIIFVNSGTYMENIEIVRKINLQGENNNNTIIEGAYHGVVVNILSDSVSIIGFTIKNAGFSPLHQYPGITLSHVKDCTISENIIFVNWFGLLIESSSDCIFSKNIVDNSYEKGGLIRNSNAIILEQNIFGNTSNGLKIQDSTNLEIINNSFLKKGITLRGTYLEQWNTHIIQNNVRDGKNICYFKDENDALIPSDPSQIILANCSNMIIQNINFLDEFTDFGYSDGCIQSGFSSHCTINDNMIITTSNDISIYQFSCTQSIISKNHIETNSGTAIELEGCSDNSIIENQIVNNLYGIILRNSHENIIQQNHIIDNYFFGIYILNSLNNFIKLNHLFNNFHGGIILTDTSDITINDNQISNDFHTSIFLESSYQIRIQNNTFPDVGGVAISDSMYITLIDNSFHSEGILITGDEEEHWTTHSIEQNNINGAPIVYYSNTQNKPVSKQATQVILANITNIEIQGLETNNIRRPIQIGFSSKITIDNNSFHHCKDCGIYLHFSENNIISQNSLSGEESVAVQTYFSMKNIIQYNTFSNNFMGIYLQFSEENIIEKNNFQLNQIQAEFVCRGLRINSIQINKWDQNYWDDLIGFGPKIIMGELLPPLKPYGHLWLNIDWHPAKTPYQTPTKLDSQLKPIDL